jgi:hypothetical protein
MSSRRKASMYSLGIRAGGMTDQVNFIGGK